MFESKDVPTYHVIITVESRPSIDRSIHVWKAGREVDDRTWYNINTRIII